MKPISIVLLIQHASFVQSRIADIRKHTKQPYELIVVNDGDCPAINKELSQIKEPSFKVVSTPERVGVAAGYNLGASYAAGERMVFMRDHVGVAKQWLEGLNRCLDQYPLAAMAGPLTNGVSGSQHVEIPVHTLLKLSRADRSKLLTPTGQSGLPTTRLLSFLLIVRKKAFEQLGGFDKAFALETYEDDDLCYRALRAGYELYIARGSIVRYTPPPALFPDDPGWFGRQMAANRQTGILKWGADVTGLLLEWKRPITVSLCMIVKDEEETLERCLSSVADLVNEIIIVDTGSTDGTKEIAGRFNARVVDFDWVNDFAKARNYAFSLATQEYQLWLDADDILLPPDRDKFRQLVSAMPSGTDVVSMPYHLSFDEHGNVTSSLRRNRLVRRSLGCQWIGMVHEYLQVSGHVLSSDIAITHDRVHTASSRNLHIYESKLREGAFFGPRDTYYFANELYDHGQWERSAEQYEKLLAFEEVWIEDRIGACGRAAECYYNLGNTHQAKLKALQSFAYALPRAENCCRLGLFHLSEQRYDEAVWWYRLAAELEMPTDSNALLLHACWTWLPHLQLCVCYDRQGQYEQAFEANERAADFIPNDSRIIANRNYLIGKLQ